MKDTAALEHAKRMLKRCCSRLHNIKSGAGSKRNPGEADDLHEHIIPVLVKAIKHAASSVGCCNMSKIEDIFSEAGNMAEGMRKTADQLESLSQKGLGFAQDVQLCLGDADQLGDERGEVPSAPGGDELERASATSPEHVAAPVTSRALTRHDAPAEQYCQPRRRKTWRHAPSLVRKRLPSESRDQS